LTSEEKERIREWLSDIEDFLIDHEDADYIDEGYRPNKAMKLHSEFKDIFYDLQDAIDAQ
jgi:hypothetical protein